MFLYTFSTGLCGTTRKIPKASTAWTVGRGGHDPSPVGPGIEQIQVLPRLDRSHGVARAAGVFVVFLDHEVTALLLTAAQQRCERSSVETMCRSSTESGGMTPGQRMISGVWVLWWYNWVLANGSGIPIVGMIGCRTGHLMVDGREVTSLADQIDQHRVAGIRHLVESLDAIVVRIAA